MKTMKNSDFYDIKSRRKEKELKIFFKYER